MVSRSRALRLSKTNFIKGLQCLKRLYWAVHEPERAAALDETTQALLDQGTEVGKVAQTAFPGGVAVESEYWDAGNALKRTAELMSDPKVPAIFEGAFCADNLIIRTDILQRARGNRWKLIEVKATKGVREEKFQVEDVAFQKHVLERASVELSSGNLMHLNPDYVYDGTHLVLEELFTIANLKGQMAPVERSLAALLQEQWDVLAKPKPPDIEPGRQCRFPYQCEFYDCCNERASDDAVSSIPRLGPKKAMLLEEMGITSIKDIPADFPLTARQRRVCECVKRGKPYFSPDLGSELKKLRYPLYYMDFETFEPAIPRFAGMRPRIAFPFQWSVHVQRTPGGDLQHYEFLADDSNDPRERFAESLLKVVEQHPESPILCYSKYEGRCLHDLAGWLPHHARPLKKVRRRLWDIFAIISKHVYHPGFGGSFSLKQVLPALVPEMTYEGMEVSDGGEASLVYDRLARTNLTATERFKWRKALLEYCRQDTLALVKLREALCDKK
jgi:hypothetical protein